MLVHILNFILTINIISNCTGQGYISPACLAKDFALRPVALACSPSNKLPTRSSSSSTKGEKLPSLHEHAEGFAAYLDPGLRVVYNNKGENIAAFATIPHKKDMEELHAKYGQLIMVMRVPESGQIFARRDWKKQQDRKRYRLNKKRCGNGIALLKIEDSVVTEMIVRKGKEIYPVNISVVYTKDGNIIDSFIKLRTPVSEEIHEKYGDFIVKRRAVAHPSVGFSVLSVSNNQISLPLKYGGEIVTSVIGANGHMINCRVKDHIPNIVCVYTLKDELVHSAAVLTADSIKKLAEKYNGFYVRLKINYNASRHFNLAGHSYYLPEYIGEQIAIYYDSEGSRTGLSLPKTLTREPKEINLDDKKGRYFSYMSKYERVDRLLPGLRSSDIFIPPDAKTINRALNRMTGDNEIRSVMRELTACNWLSDDATMGLLRIVDGSKPSLRRRFEGWCDPKASIISLLDALKPATYQMKLIDEHVALSAKEKSALARTISKALKAQNLLIKSYSYVILDAIAYTPTLLSDVRKKPDQLPIYFSYGVDGLRKAIWAYDFSKNKHISAFAFYKIRGAINEARRQEKMRADIVGRKDIGIKSPARFDSDNIQEPEAVDSISSYEAIQRSELWALLTDGFSRMEKRILISYFVHRKTLMEISHDLGLSQTTIFNRLKSIVQRLKASEDKVRLLVGFIGIDLQEYLKALSTVKGRAEGKTSAVALKIYEAINAAA